ncbi:hypothetical protein GCM10011348_29850 [Marinobacterium nitratireducens]|uniref:Cyclic nucleotide-binding domain-containing protein n=2 Tax=Marinobacterium nitratireducens TaxID=518897 RepID=A0A918DVG4_9GAMM|nr:hypothetical protein GCM10011348_29850 [Marinobacterium nitratireducens]
MSAFGALPDTFIEKVLQFGELVHLEKGELLFRKGERPESFFIVLSGDITIYDDTDAGRHNIRTTDIGESLGFPAMIALRPRMFSSVANCDCLVLRITSQHFAELYEWNLPQFAIFYMNLSRDMSRFLRNCAGVSDENDAVSD